MSEYTSEPIKNEQPGAVPILPFETKSMPQSERLTVEGSLKTLQNVLSLVVGFGAILTASGFVIVNSYLGQYTDIHAYSILPGQYLTGGIGLWIVLLAVSGFLFSITRVFKNRNLVRSVQRINILYRVILIGICIVIGGFIYGRVIYGAVPRYLGGGAPVPIYLVFRNSEDISEAGFIPSILYPNISTSVLLLAEVSDGLLVYNSPADGTLTTTFAPAGIEQKDDVPFTQPGFTAIVKGDLIRGIIDSRGAFDAFQDLLDLYDVQLNMQN